MKLIIAGTRPPNNIMMNAPLVEEWHNERLSILHDVLMNDDVQHELNDSIDGFRYVEAEVVCGCAWGWDEVGRRWATSILGPDRVKEMPAHWHQSGKFVPGAGHIRNRQMGDYADALLAFHDGQSRGTQGMINYMESLNKPTIVIPLDENHWPIIVPPAQKGLLR